MNASVDIIPLNRLALALIPVLVVILVQQRWKLPVRPTIYGAVRMLAQLLLVGYVLVFLFDTDSSLIVFGVLAMMIMVASWIALRPMGHDRPRLYWTALGAIMVGGVPTLFLTTQWVIDVTLWYAPRYLIPLAGMIFSHSMNSVSIAAERYAAEMNNGQKEESARRTAFQAALIPLVNSLMAVGLVSLPGMMTGQVLAGVSPLIAARYQIMIMCVLFGAAGLSAVCYLYWARKVR